MRTDCGSQREPAKKPEAAAEEQHASPVANISEGDRLIVDDSGNAFQRQAAIAWGSVLRTCVSGNGKGQKYSGGDEFANHQRSPIRACELAGRYST